MQGHESDEGIKILDAATVQQLIALQALDDHIKAMGERQLDQPKMLAERKADLAAGKIEEAAAKQLVMDTQKRIDLLNVESKALQSEIERLDGQLFQLKSNTEFETMKLQIKGKKEQDKVRQDQALELMLMMDDLKAAHESAASRAQDAEEKVAESEASVREELKRLESDVASETAQRDTSAQALDPEVWELYEAVRARRQGKGIALVSDEFCLGCDTRVMPKYLNALRMGRMEQCPHCDRIMYVLRTD